MPVKYQALKLSIRIVAAGRGVSAEPVGDPARAEADRSRGCPARSDQQQVPTGKQNQLGISIHSKSE